MKGESSDPRWPQVNSYVSPQVTAHHPAVPYLGQLRVFRVEMRTSKEEICHLYRCSLHLCSKSVSSGQRKCGLCKARWATTTCKMEGTLACQAQCEGCLAAMLSILKEVNWNLYVSKEYHVEYPFRSWVPFHTHNLIVLSNSIGCHLLKVLTFGFVCHQNGDIIHQLRRPVEDRHDFW